MTRKACVRLLKRFYSSINKEIRIFEANDGIEILSLYYSFLMNGVSLYHIISDQTMNIMNGSVCAKLLNETYSNRGLKKIPFFILTAYQYLTFESKGVEKIFSKPLVNKMIEEINHYIQIL